MLFKRLYNWIKHKTLPTSFLFKNRLFIERDSKHRRIYNIFGSIFRNSKWGNYELTNLKLQLKFKFRYFFLRLVIWGLVFLLFLLKKYWNDIDFVGAACFVGWTIIEAVDYCFLFFVWLILFIFYTTLNWLYTYFLEQLFGSVVKKPDIVLKSFFEFYNERFLIKTNKDLNPTFSFYNFFCSWVCKLGDRERSSFFPPLFEQQKSKHHLYELSHMHTLFKINYLLGLLNTYYTISGDNNKLTSIITKIYKTPIISESIFSVRSLWVDNLVTLYFNPSTNFMFLFLDNTFSMFTEKVPSSPSNIKDISKVLYFTKLNFNDISYFNSQIKQFPQMQHDLRRQLNSTKWDRWLYRYSILHRRIFKNSHKLTSTKRLFQSGFYQKSFLKKNTWMNHRAPFFKKSLNTQLTNLYYSEFFKIHQKLSWINTTSLMTFLTTQQHKNFNFSQYENSFFWFIKRFQFFNTLETNTISSRLSLPDCKQLQEDAKSLTFVHFQTFLNILSQAYFPLQVHFLPNNLLNKNNHFSKNFSYTQNQYFSKDLSLSFEDQELMFGDYQDFLYWISSPKFTASQQPLIIFIDIDCFTSSSATLEGAIIDNHKMSDITYHSTLLDQVYHIILIDTTMWGQFFIYELCNTKFI